MEKPERHLVYSAIKCISCNTTLVSYHRRDFKQCECSNKTFIDGGLSNPRYGAESMANTHIAQIYSDDLFDGVRKYATRGSKGKDGKDPLTWIPLCQMTNSHLENVILYGGAAWHLELISKELQYRREHNIVIEEEYGSKR